VESKAQIHPVVTRIPNTRAAQFSAPTQLSTFNKTERGGKRERARRKINPVVTRIPNTRAAQFSAPTQLSTFNKN
jgi:hypothetical protein